MAELYEVLDPRPNAASAPYTFFLPDPELIEAICKGDHVKAIIRAVPPSEKYDAERMWIRITSARSDWLEGTLDSQREYWARCMVDQCVLDRELKVGYIYREAPDMTKEGDKFPDSGWRIRGDTRGTLVEQLRSRKAAYVALGAVLNSDDSWLHLIDEPVGARFEKDFEKGVFVPEK